MARVSCSRKSSGALVIQHPRWFIVVGKLSYWLIGWSMIGIDRETRLDRHFLPLSVAVDLYQSICWDQVKADCTKHCSNFRSNPLAKEGDKTTISIRIVRATGNALRMKLAPPRFKTNPFQPISRPVQTSQHLESLQNFAQEFATFPRRGPRKFVLSNFRKTFASLCWPTSMKLFEKRFSKWNS